MSIFSGIRAGLSRIKSAVSAGVSRVKSAITGVGKAAAQVSRDLPMPGELPKPQVPTPHEFDTMRAPSTQQIRDKQWEFKARRAGTDLSPYSRKDIDDFYGATRRIWEGAPNAERNARIKEYFSSHYGIDDMEAIYDFVHENLQEDSDDNEQDYNEQEKSPDAWDIPVLYFG